MNNNKLEILPFQSKAINLKVNRPNIFIKKIQNNSKVIPLSVIYSDTGQTRHYPPAAQEWYNSVYAYNNNYIKTIPTADRNLMKLVKSYFNFYFSKNLLKTKNLETRYKRLSAKKIFVGKGELKHTSSRVIITLYVYNTEKKFILNKIWKLFKILFLTKKRLKAYSTIDRSGNKVITYNRPFKLIEFLNLPDHYLNYLSFITLLINKLTNYLDSILEYNKNIMKLVDLKVLTKDEQLLIFNDKLNSFYSLKYPNYKYYMNKVFSSYLNELWAYMCLLKLNEAKFTETYIYKLSQLVKNIYNKEVEFNIVNLKKMHLNSDIFTQAVSLKLRNRSNSLHRVLKSSLSRVKLPYVMKIDQNFVLRNKDEVFVNKIRNKKINSMFKENIKKDPLNNLLVGIFPLTGNLKIAIKDKFYIIRRRISLMNFIFNSLKHINMAGVRIEAKGRLTKRSTASRSVFKMRWKGGLKNVDSSFRGLSAVILRGHVKSNIQYSLINSKNRNGAFGIKGWVSSK